MLGTPLSSPIFDPILFYGNTYETRHWLWRFEKWALLLFMIDTSNNVVAYLVWSLAGANWGAKWGASWGTN